MTGHINADCTEISRCQGNIRDRPRGWRNCPAEEATSTELSPAQSDESEPAAKGAGADQAPEETAATHIRSSSGGDMGTENCQIAAPRRRLASRTPLLKITTARQ